MRKIKVTKVDETFEVSKIYMMGSIMSLSAAELRAMAGEALRNSGMNVRMGYFHGMSWAMGEVDDFMLEVADLLDRNEIPEVYND